MNRRAAYLIRTGILWGRDDLHAIHLGLPSLAPLFLLAAHPLTARAWDRTVQHRKGATA